MAKKVIATLTKGEAKKLTKLIQLKKSEKTDAYTFKSSIVSPEMLKEILSAKA